MAKDIKETLQSFLGLIAFIAIFGFGIYSLITEGHWIILSIIALGIILTVIFFILVLVPGLEAGFRNRFPLDYLIHINAEIDFFTSSGFTVKEYLDSGSENPGVVLENNGKVIVIKLDAPVNASKYTIQITSPTGELDTLEYDTSTEESEKASKLIRFYEELISA
ncbi:hypothetical protein [uncultured Duncaniella sp.]|uniref:hypothetical protein n=1 Tax=uncultured Duncaniella sp. TaxID=2768039 RepID=UPI0025FF0374|nr:hypothetical protein [uncultured Duncaniella sp.]